MAQLWRGGRGVGQLPGHITLNGGSLWTLTQKTHFPKEFLTKLSIYKDYSKTLILTKEKLTEKNVRFRKYEAKH